MRRVLAAALVAFGVAACATDVGPIDRTQHDKVEKKVLAGVWYFTQTVIDIPFNAAFTFVGETAFGQNAKVIFDVQEKYLVVYPVSEYVAGAEKPYLTPHKFFKYWDEDCLSSESEQHQCVDGKDNLHEPTRKCCFIELYVGQPLAAFKILSHFDVIRDYNPQTGEQNNVLVENTTDRKWWQRRYIRVDWAKNYINDFTFMARVAKQTPVDYYVQTFETDNPDAPTITKDYIDVVTKVWGEPESAGACYIYGVSYGDCASALVKFRLAFRKVDPNHEYEPLRFHNEDRQGWFGYFLTERYSYDENWGTTESGRLSYINRWNIWQDPFEESDVLDQNGNPKQCFKDLKDTGCDTTNKNGSKEYCAARDWFEHGTCKKLTPKPYTERGLRPVVYHVSYNLPENLWDATVRMANEWSEALKETVAWLYYWEEKGMIYGQDSSRVCDTDQDCAAEAFLDTFVDVDEPAPQQKRLPAQTVLITSSSREGLVLVDSDYPAGLQGKVAVRLVNLSDAPQSLLVNGQKALDGVGPLKGKGPHQVDYAVVDASGNATIKVGNAQTSVQHSPKWVITVVYDGTKLVVANNVSWAATGLRIVNVTGTALDVSVDGALRFANLQPGFNTGYLQIAGGTDVQGTPYGGFAPQRVVAVPAFSRGDVTCFRNELYGGETLGRCVGYKAPIDWKRLEQIKVKLPEMFVICRNQYDPNYDDQWKSALYAPWKDVLNVPEDQLPVKNPCVDFLFHADKMTEQEKLAQAKAMKKAGDNRYSMVYWIPDAQLASPLGYGPSAADPDTGEIFWATANIYGAPLYTIASLVRDLFDIMNGNLDVSNWVTGQSIRDFLLQKKATKKTSALTAGTLVPDDDAREAHEATRSGKMGMAPSLSKQGQKVPLMEQVLGDLLDQKKLVKMMSHLPVVDPALGKQRLALLKGTPYEDMMINDEVKLALSGGRLGPGDAYDDAMKQELSPLNWGTLGEILQKQRQNFTFLSKHNYCYASFSDEGLLGIAKSWGCAPNDPRPDCAGDPNWSPLDHHNDYQNTCCFHDGQKLAEAIVARYYTPIVEHEVGHTLGLRHNFEGSSDLFNYFDEYYDIREKEYVPCKVNEECETWNGQYCGDDGYCHWNRVSSCKTDADCITGPDGKQFQALYDFYKCVGGQCVELERCDPRGYCVTDGAVCNGEDWHCYKDGKLIQKPVQDGVDTRVTQMIPRSGLTEQEALRGRTTYQYSTVMDYGQRWNSDIMDLGKYDLAAIRFGYGQLVDVYENPHQVWDSVHRLASSLGEQDARYAWLSDGGVWSWGVFSSQLYYLQNYIGVENNKWERWGSAGKYSHNRAAVPYDWVVLANGMGLNYYREELDKSYLVVPYKFCGDEYAGNVGCYTWDTGMDVLEIVHNFRIMLKQYYLVDAFKRERYGFGRYGDPYYYFARVLSRYMDPMQDASMFYALYAHILKDYGAFRGIWQTARMEGWALRRAAETSFEALAEVLASPAPGSYALDGQNIYRMKAEKLGQGQLDLPLGEGKYPYTRFDPNAGYFYFEHPVNIGSFWEKLAAIMTLTDSTVYFTTNYVGEQLNIGVGTSIGFNTLYPRELIELFGGLVADDLQYYAWREGADGIQGRRFFEPSNSMAYDTMPAVYATYQPPEKDAKLVEPSITSLTLKLYAMVYAMAFLPASFDPSFVDAFAVCLKGNGNCFNLATASGVQTVEFLDPFGGKTYVAWNSKYTKDWYTPNVSLIDRANELKSSWENETDTFKRAALEKRLKDVIATLDLMRGLWEIFSAIKI